jgi:hypothetical protein
VQVHQLHEISKQFTDCYNQFKLKPSSEDEPDDLHRITKQFIDHYNRLKPLTEEEEDALPEITKRQIDAYNRLGPSTIELSNRPYISKQFLHSWMVGWQ